MVHYGALSFLIVRLIGAGQVVNQGRVEVLFSGVWGRICSVSTWDAQAANVVCRQLGYHGAVAAGYNGEFVRAGGLIGVTNVLCIGNETAVSQCTSGRMGWGVVSECPPHDEAGIICSSSGESNLCPGKGVGSEIRGSG